MLPTMRSANLRPNSFRKEYGMRVIDADAFSRFLELRYLKKDVEEVLLDSYDVEEV